MDKRSKETEIQNKTIINYHSGQYIESSDAMHRASLVEAIAPCVMTREYHVFQFSTLRR